MLHWSCFEFPRYSIETSVNGTFNLLQFFFLVFNHQVSRHFQLVQFEFFIRNFVMGAANDMPIIYGATQLLTLLPFFSLSTEATLSPDPFSLFHLLCPLKTHPIHYLWASKS